MSKRSNKRRAQVDVQTFVNDFVEGKLTPSQLAVRHNRSPREIDDMLAGRKHKRVLAGIEKAMASRRDRTVRQLALLQDDAVAAMEKAVRGQADNVSLSAAREILNRSLDAPSRAPSAEPRRSAGRAAQPRPAPAKLAPEQKRRVLAKLDGPAPEG